MSPQPTEAMRNRWLAEDVIRPDADAAIDSYRRGLLSITDLIRRLGELAAWAGIEAIAD